MNKLKDLSILKRAAKMLTGAGRVAAVLFAVILTMTSQTAWALVNDEFTVEYVKYKVTSESPNEVQIVGYENGVAADLVIPATVTNGSVYSVTSIDVSAFSWCNNLTSIVIPNSVTSIGEGAFFDCNNLTSIVIPNSVTSIGHSAFDHCGKLTSVSIPSSVTTISSNTFSSCSNLTSVIIPSSVTSIGVGAFSGCEKLMVVVAQRYISEGSPSITSLGNNAFEGCYALAMICVPNAEACTAYKNDTNWSQYTDKIHSISEGNNSGYCGDPKVNDGKNVYYAYYKKSKSNEASLIIAGSGTMNSRPWSGFAIYIKSVNIGDGVTSIVSNAFNDFSGLTSVTIPASVTSIGESAFRNCSKLTSIAIPASVTGIGENAFYGCEKLESINVDGNNQNYVSEDGVLFNKDKTTLVKYPESKSGTSYDIPASVTSIGESAFQGCRNLTSITIPASVTSIGEYAFNGCSNLTSVIIPASVTSIGENAFFGCGKLESINVDVNNQNYVSEDGALFNKDKTILIRYPQGKSGTSYDTPASVTTISEYAFNNCSNLTSITIPASVTSIGNNAFNGCGSLTSVTIPASVTSIGEDAFCGCTSVENVYCFADPDKLTWEEGWCDDFITNSDPNYPTKCHVFKESAWDGFKSTVNVTFVGDLGSITCPVELTEATGVDLLTSLAGRTDITAPLNVSFKRTFTSGVASTVCLPFDFTPTGGTYYVFHSVDKSTTPWTVTMAEADPDNRAQTDANGHLLADTPYLFMPAADGEVTFSGTIATVASSYTAGSVTKAATNADGTNDAAHEWQFKGTYVLRTWYDADPGNIYAFSANQITATDGVSTIHAGDFFRISGGDKSRLRPFRACMEYVTKTSQARGMSRTSADNEVLPEKMTVRLIGLDGTPTQIGTLDTHTGEVTFDGDAWYSLDGRRLSAKPNAKGVYIHNGKTVVVK